MGVSRYALAGWLVFWNALPHRWPQRRLPTADELEAAAPGRRVLVCVRDLHRVAVSPAALADLGLNRDRDRWRAGEVMRDRRGRPTGELWEHTCGAAVQAMLADIDEQMDAAGADGVTARGAAAPARLRQHPRPRRVRPGLPP